MSTADNQRVVAEFVRPCQDQHDLAFADDVFHPRLVNHYRPEGRVIQATERPASGFQTFYGSLLRAFPDATMEVNQQIAERDLVTTRKTLRARIWASSGIWRRQAPGALDLHRPGRAERSQMQ